MPENQKNENSASQDAQDSLEAQMQNCLFCKIISGDIPSKKVYEDPDFIGILDINPASEGHILLLTKKHFQIMPQMPPDIVGKMGIASKNISGKLLKGFGAEGTSIFVANGYVAGQKAPHFIMHVIPRKESDSIALNPKLLEISEKDYTATKLLIAKAMNVPVSVNYSTQSAQPKQAAPQESTEELKEETSEQIDKIDTKPNEDKPKKKSQKTKSTTKKENKDQESKSNSVSTTSTNNRRDSDSVDLDKIARMFIK